MRVLTAAVASSLVLAACGTAAEPAPGGAAADGNDCAVIAAVAKEHYGFNAENPPPPLWLDAEGANWAPRCDWSRYGISFPRIHDPSQTGEPGRRVQWVSFKRPRYDGQGALVETGILHGPLNGRGGTCRVRSGFAGWTVASCEDTWIS